MKLADVERLAAEGESQEVEFKKSTSQLRRAGETLCGLLNGTGGFVVIGMTPEGQVIGQTVADTTLRDIAALLQRFEPAAPVPGGRQVSLPGQPPGPRPRLPAAR